MDPNSRGKGLDSKKPTKYSIGGFIKGVQTENQASAQFIVAGCCKSKRSRSSRSTCLHTSRSKHNRNLSAVLSNSIDLLLLL